MAGLFGFLDPTRPGKGVDKENPEKRRFFYFWELFFRKFWRLVKLNFIYILFCLPIVTIGPATAGLCKVMKSFTTEKPVFLFSDFMDGFKSDFKQSFLMGLINIVFGFGGANAIYFYYVSGQDNAMYYVLMVLCMIAMLFLILINFYIYIMISSVADMKFSVKFRNSFFLSFLGIKSNIITLVSLALIAFLSLYFLFFGAAIALICGFSFIYFLIVFNSYPVIEKYIINPYYEQTGEKRPDTYYFDELEEEIALFEDMGRSEIPQPPSSTKGKVIK